MDTIQAVTKCCRWHGVSYWLIGLLTVASYPSLLTSAMPNCLIAYRSVRQSPLMLSLSCPSRQWETHQNCRLVWFKSWASIMEIRGSTGVGWSTLLVLSCFCFTDAHKDWQSIWFVQASRGRNNLYHMKLTLHHTSCLQSGQQHLDFGLCVDLVKGWMDLLFLYPTTVSKIRILAATYCQHECVADQLHQQHAEMHLVLCHWLYICFTRCFISIAFCCGTHQGYLHTWHMAQHHYLNCWFNSFTWCPYEMS